MRDLHNLLKLFDASFVSLILVNFVPWKFSG